MFDRLRNDWKRLLSEMVAMLAAFLVLRYATTAVFGSADGSDLTGIARLVIGIVVVAGLSLFLIGGTHLVFAVRRSVETMKIAVGAPDGWPPASVASRSHFAALGFEQFGSIEVTLPDHTATFAGMLSPDGTTMGIVTPAHITMVTDFNGKILTTTSHPAGAPLRYELRQSIRHGSPEALWECHRQAIAIVAESAMAPTIYSARTALTDLIAIEECSKSHFVMSDQAKGLVGRRRMSLAHDRRAKVKIAAWRDSPYRWESNVS